MIMLKGTIFIIFKVYGLKCIKVSDYDEFQFRVKIEELKTYLTFSSSTWLSNYLLWKYLWKIFLKFSKH